MSHIYGLEPLTANSPGVEKAIWIREKEVHRMQYDIQQLKAISVYQDQIIAALNENRTLKAKVTQLELEKMKNKKGKL